MKSALITGITGQDGSYLAELLISKGYVVHGIIRRSSSFNTGRIRHIYQDPHSESPRLVLHYGDVLDSESLGRVLAKAALDEIYNLAAQSHVRVSFDMPTYTAESVFMGALRLLEAVRTYERKKIRFYQASSSEMFGGIGEVALNEQSPLVPRSPYAVAKVAAYHQTVNYRQAFGIFACNGILFNHESPRRGETFVTRKITRGLALILAGRERHLHLGNLAAKRDWGFAADYVDAMWRMLQHETADDYVVSTGQTWSVQQFLDRACALVQLDPSDIVQIDPTYFRPTEVDHLLGDASKARTVLGWEPRHGFDELVGMMVAADLRREGVDPEQFPGLQPYLELAQRHA
ncbi:MAG: GDP-mannose 4,6-dehydratase [Deltaproteobacteria bacterium]|nr:GDP-mannose 4,6-dehydratase [Deltaproteobacteria bacterium]